jgi:murein DD-endopeptidase MepM/ murein hydrolase activator NlpD
MTATRRRGTLPLILTLLVAVVLSAAALVVGPPAQAAPAPFVGSVPAGTVLVGGSVVTSPNGQFRLTAQGDGNLVMYGIGNRVLWASNTSTATGATFVPQADGNLVIYRAGKAVWSTGSSGRGAVSLAVTDDGNFAMRQASGANAWNAGSFQDRVAAGSVLLPGTTLRPSATSGTRLVMQPDGNLVHYDGATAVWSSSSSRWPGSTAAVQTDGNLVVYAADKHAVWASNTDHSGAGQLLVQVDGNVVLYGASGTRAWSSRPVAGLRWPVVSQRITGRYGDDRGAGHTPRYHQGTDAGVGIGTTVYASGTGTVTSTVIGNATYGNYIVVTYGLTTVLTAHLSAINVSQGQTVSLNTVIGASGNTGQVTGPHVHVETRVQGTLVDPLSVLSFR